MADKQTKADLDWLVENSDRTLGSVYHDAGSCWRLIEAALEEIRKLRNEVAFLQKAASNTDAEDHKWNQD